MSMAPEFYIDPAGLVQPDKHAVNKVKFRDAVVNVFNELERILLKKHADYGPHNIGRSPGGPMNGLRVRMHDKLARINHLIDSGADPQNESLRDSLIDLANYAAIGILVLDGDWPGE